MTTGDKIIWIIFAVAARVTTSEIRPVMIAKDASMMLKYFKQVAKGQEPHDES